MNPIETTPLTAARTLPIHAEPRSPRRRLILMRHGAVRYFEPESPRPLPAEQVQLTPEGETQARAAGALLAAAGLRPDRIVHSGLPRTRRSAELVRQACGGPALEVREAFQEIHGGRLRDLAPERLREAFTAFNQGPLTPDSRFLGGESLGELQQRLLPAFEQLRAEPGWDCLLLVAHGVVNAALLSYLVSGGSHQVFGGWQQNPACLNLIDLGERPGDDLLRAVNLNPTDWLQADQRHSTMERLFDEFSAWRQRHAGTP